MEWLGAGLPPAVDRPLAFYFTLGEVLAVLVAKASPPSLGLDGEVAHPEVLLT